VETNEIARSVNIATTMDADDPMYGRTMVRPIVRMAMATTQRRQSQHDAPQQQ
jgi:hypothetical protein